MVYNGTQKQMFPVPGMVIQWPGGTIPPDVPACGFKNDNPVCMASMYALSSNTYFIYIFTIRSYMEYCVFL